MEKKVYRNALRSKAMIRTAFIELTAEKPIEKISVVDIVNRSDLSRNTFYAHYQDVYAVLEEFQHDVIEQLKIYLEQAMTEKAFDDPLSFLQKISEYIDNNKSTFCVLLKAGNPEDFINQIKNIILEFIFVNIDETGINDKNGFAVFLEIMIMGFIHLMRQYIQDKGCMNSEDIVKEINRIYINAMPLYR